MPAANIEATIGRRSAAATTNTPSRVMMPVVTTSPDHVRGRGRGAVLDLPAPVRADRAPGLGGEPDDEGREVDREAEVDEVEPPLEARGALAPQEQDVVDDDRQRDGEQDREQHPLE